LLRLADSHPVTTRSQRIRTKQPTNEEKIAVLAWLVKLRPRAHQCVHSSTGLPLCASLLFLAAKNPVLRLGHLPNSTSAYQQKKRVTAPRLIIRLRPRNKRQSTILSQRSSYFLGYLVSALKRPQKSPRQNKSSAIQRQTGH
jgi:hypothetical protein